MSALHEHNPNPYQSPMVETSTVDAPLELERSLANLLNVFHSQIFILGCFWIFAGLLALVFAAGSAELLDIHIGGRPRYTWTAILCGTCGIVWIFSGGMTCRQSMWAIYVGMVISYAVLAAAILSGYLCFPSVFLVAAVVQSHRIIRWAKKLSAAAIPLTARPRKIQYPLPD